MTTETSLDTPAAPQASTPLQYDIMLAVRDTTDDQGRPALDVDMLSRTGVIDVEAPSTILAVWIAENMDNIMHWARHAHAARKAAAQAPVEQPAEDAVIKGINPKLLGPDGRVLN